MTFLERGKVVVNKPRRMVEKIIEVSLILDKILLNRKIC